MCADSCPLPSYCPDLVAGKMAVFCMIRIILYFVLYLYYVLSYPGLLCVSTMNEHRLSLCPALVRPAGVSTCAMSSNTQPSGHQKTGGGEARRQPLSIKTTRTGVLAGSHTPGPLAQTGCKSEFARRTCRDRISAVLQ